jgi:phosphoketolase
MEQRSDPVLKRAGQAGALTPEEGSALERYRRAVNYLAAAQIYLRANPLLEEPLRPEHIKHRLLGHWGTAPGINLIYQHLNRLILRTEASILLVIGPGHGAAANLANMYLEGILTEYFPELTQDRAGLQRFLTWFSWPDAFPSHLSPGYPGVIHEGGELGYALATAFGAALDNPDLIVACIVGDGEAETGPTAGAWHSNKFLNPATDGAVLEATDRQYVWPVPEVTEHTGRDGRVLEVLSEHDCQGWLQGYLLTGRHGVFPCYEAFLPIVDGMMNQYAKFLKASLEGPWRELISSLNYLLTSEAWRQEHNGYSHQGPGFINNLLTKKGHTYRIYLPPDANCLLVTMDHCLRVTDFINLVIAGKQPMPQWLSLEEAQDHCRIGASVWRWAGTNEGEDPEVIFACCGDNLTLEVMAAVDLLRQEVPRWRVRVVNVADLLVLGIPQKYPHGLDEDRFRRLFPLGCPVIFNFHGYTAAIKQLLWERPHNDRFDINGYREEGTTTTPFDMHVRNRTSRYHLVIQAAQKMAARTPTVAAAAEGLVVRYERRLADHRAFVREEGVDPPEIAGWRWRDGKAPVA